MTLIKSISGIRGIIGGRVGENLTPLDIVKFSCSYGIWIKKNFPNCKPSVVLGRDARVSGKIIKKLVSASLQALSIDVLDLDLSTTPTVQMAVILEKTHGGIIITASHNPSHWNALKMFNSDGEFISEKSGKEILDITQQEESFLFATIEDIGRCIFIKNGYVTQHINKILQLPLVDKLSIKKARLKIIVDAVNSTGGLAVPLLLKRLGVKVVEMYCKPNGLFPHNPEPLKEHLSEISKKVPRLKVDMGIVVDPDVDRLVFICENGEFFGEEYTLVAISDYVLSKQPGSVVSSLSSSRALKDIASRWNVPYHYSAVGEVNVVTCMKKNNAVIGGEGNGGVIYPDLHYGRDALVGIALFLTYLVYSRKNVSNLKKQYSSYFMVKKKIECDLQVNLSDIFEELIKKYQYWKPDSTDGLKIDFINEWVHLRKSNTEPVIRIYTESTSYEKAYILSEKFIKEVKNFILCQQTKSTVYHTLKE